MEKKKISGFVVQPESKFLDPLLIRCRPINIDPETNLPVDQVVGRVCRKYKRLRSDKTYKLWVVYGRDNTGGFGLYFKEEKDVSAFKLVKGSFRFVFDAENFALIALNSDRDTLKYFMANCVVEKKAELLKFVRLVKGELSPLRHEVVFSLLGDVAINC